MMMMMILMMMTFRPEDTAAGGR